MGNTYLLNGRYQNKAKVQMTFYDAYISTGGGCIRSCQTL